MLKFNNKYPKHCYEKNCCIYLQTWWIVGKDPKNANAELVGGARVHHIFSEIFTTAINKIDPFDLTLDNVILCNINKLFL